jgi:hypothetical protein
VKHKLVLLAVGALMSGMLTGCGGSDTDAYCDSLKDAKADIESLDAGDVAQFDEAFKTIHKLADEAPDEVKDDWEVLDGALSDMEKALNDAGLELSDLEGLSSGQLPEGVDQAKLAQLGEQMQAIASDEVTEAGENIDKHAEDECGIKIQS